MQAHNLKLSHEVDESVVTTRRSSRALHAQPWKDHSAVVASCDNLVCSGSGDNRQKTMTLETLAEQETDEELMEAYRDGDMASFDRLFNRYKDLMYRYLVKQCGNVAIAEELFQEVWAGIIRHRDRYVVTAKFKTYIFTIAHSKLIDYYRQKSKADLLSYDEHEFDIEDSNTGSLEHQTDIKKKSIKLMELVEKLPAAQREVFMMHEESGMSLSEIAQIINVTRDTAKSRLRYAVQRLRRYMERYR